MRIQQFNAVCLVADIIDKNVDYRLSDRPIFIQFQTYFRGSKVISHKLVDRRWPMPGVTQIRLIMIPQAGPHRLNYQPSRPFPLQYLELSYS
jgi:hypothetical protein